MNTNKFHASLYQEISSNDLTTDDKGNLKFKGLAFNGTSVERYFGMLGIDLSNIELYNKTSSEVPLLWGHGEYAPAIGRATVSFGQDISISDGVIYNSENIPNARATIDLINNGHPIQLSIGVSGNILYLEKTEQRLLNGKNQLVDAILQDVVLQEISFVNIPADSSTFVTKMNRESKENKENEKMTITQEQLNAVNDANTSLSTQLAKEKAEGLALKTQLDELVKKNQSLELEQKLSNVKEKFAKYKLSDTLIKTLVNLSDEEQAEFVKTFEEKTPAVDLSKDPNINDDADKNSKVVHFAGLKIDTVTRKVSLA